MFWQQKNFHLAEFPCFTWLLVLTRYNLGTNCDVLNEVVSSANVLNCDFRKC